MIQIIADNIISPLGESTAANVKAVRLGMSALREHHLPGMPESFMASLFEPSIGFEQGVIRTIEASLQVARDKGCEVDVTSKEVVIIISTTKGNIAEFERIGASAEKIGRHFGNPNCPIVVSNACISGLSAMILAMRLLRLGYYQDAIVAGMDVQGKFIVSGFQSFKALSPEACRPFDGDRCGLNLGEAAASVILRRNEMTMADCWCLEDGCIRNDAVHISNPSRTGEGCFRAISQVAKESADWTCISAHGTATLYNDEMEACAIERAGLSAVPTFSLKGYYGHTMGAAGILESIITLYAVEDGWIPATRGYEEPGTVHEIHVTSQEEMAETKHILKLLSGFGGCNAALSFCRTDVTNDVQVDTPVSFVHTEKEILTPEVVPSGLSALYKQEVGNYPKFYKMDPLCKLGFLAAERLLRRTIREVEKAPDESCAVVLFSKHGSLADDKAYEETIRNEEEYFPSPAVFVYTLSNIVTGEIAIRHHFLGESSCYILEEKNWDLMTKILSTTFLDTGIRTIVGGWVDYEDDQHFEADLKLFQRRNV